MNKNSEAYTVSSLKHLWKSSKGIKLLVLEISPKFSDI